MDITPVLQSLSRIAMSPNNMKRASTRRAIVNASSTILRAWSVLPSLDRCDPE